ncbi:MAG TPA: NAD-dependent epimerase/dehydratase family protein [Thermoanaerobaculia bacterium]|nr:NAD-dependent epimerase/dehydratase family protein [Thermoanaerobaculia bacterium]
MRVLVTGVGGFLGGALARALLARGHQVAGTWVDAPFHWPGVEPHEADVRDAARLREVMRETAPDAVVHLAGLSHVGESWTRMPEYFQVNVLGTENVLAAAAGGPRVVVASSAEVYGQVPEDEQPIGEARPPAPRTPYALTKAAAERLALTRGAIVARSFNLVGAGQSPSFALPAFAAQLAAMAESGEPVLRVGNLTPRRDFVHVEDGAEAFALLAERGEPGTVYNVASGCAPSMAEALARLIALAGVAARVEEDPERVRPVDLPLLRGDASRLRGLGWSPRRGLDDALADLWAAVRPGG